MARSRTVKKENSKVIGGVNAKLILALILCFAWVTRVYRLEVPKTYYFDEVYHAFTAEAYSRNDPAGYEWWHTSPIQGTAYEWLHPPISKLLMGLSIHTFGNISYAWRLPSAIFGILVIAAIYWLTVSLTQKREIGLLAAFLGSLDGLLLTQSRIAMNDIFVTFFVLMALAYYWKWWLQSIPGSAAGATRSWDLSLWLSGVFTGLAVSTKWSGVFVVGIVGLWEIMMAGFGIGKLISDRKLITKPQKIIESLKQTLFRGVMRVVKLLLVFGVLPVVIYVASYGQWWLQGHTWKQFGELHNQIWWYETNLKATHPYQSKPWQWVLDLKPVWFWVDYTQTGDIGNIYALANPAIAWLGLGAMAWLLIYGVMKKKPELVFVLLSYLAVWGPWTLSPRIMFFYHYTPAIPFLVIALAYLVWWLWQTKRRWARVVATALIAIPVILFIYFFPHWTGIIVPVEWADQYYWFKSWK